MTPIIQVTHLSKIFKIETKQSGFLPRIRSLFHPEYTEYEAVSDISFSVQK